MSRLLPLCVLFVCSMGCSGEPRLYRVSGVVRFQGQPVPRGDIRFEPDSERGGKGPGFLATIKDGVFRSPDEMGVLPGPVIVIIRGFDGKDAAEKQDGPAPYVGFALFPEHTMKLDLDAKDHTLEIDVP